MPIDISVPQSPGWWLDRLFRKLNDRHRRRRLQLLHDVQRGRGPLPAGHETARESFAGFQRMARTVYGPLITGAVSNKMRIRGFKSAVDDDTTGDAVVGRLWKRAGMKVVSTEVHEHMLTLSEAYVIVGLVDEETGAPLITCEDPRTMVAEEAPGNPRKLLAALKILHDDTVREDRAYVYLPGQVWVAKRTKSTTDMFNATVYTDHRSHLSLPFDARAWEWDTDRSGQLPHNRLPVVRFTNKDKMGEFEPFLDVMDRISQQVLQRMVIATMQAWRQRAVQGLPDVYPEDHPNAGEPIDYSEVFTSDPGAFWQLPEAAKMWESQPVDLRPLLEAVKNDVIELASSTQTPLHMLQPGGDNQSAEGAASQREGLVDKVGNRIDLVDDLWARVMSLALLHAGEPKRADLAHLEVIWAPVERLSLAEKADAAAKAANDMPRRTRLIKIWGEDPAEADRIMAEWEDELFAQQLAAQTAAAAVNPAAAPPVPAVPGSPVGQTTTQSTPTVETPSGVTGAPPARAGSGQGG